MTVRNMFMGKLRKPQTRFSVEICTGTEKSVFWLHFPQLYRSSKRNGVFRI